MTGVPKSRKSCLPRKFNHLEKYKLQKWLFSAILTTATFRKNVTGTPDGVEFAFETSGREAVVEIALGSLASHGLLGLVGVPPKPESSSSINLASLITFGHRIHGIVEGDSDLQSFIPELIQLYRAGKFPFDTLIKTYPLDRINDAVADQARGKCVKAVLIP